MSGSAGDPPDQPDTPEEIERRVSEIEAELRRPAKFKEPSAAERARKPVKLAGLRNARKARKLRRPVPEPPPRPGFAQPRAGFAQPPPPRPARRGKVWSLLIAVVIIAGLSVAAVELPKLGLGKTPGRADNTPVTNGATPTGRPTASTGSGASFLPTPTVAAPFLGTPAQSYADGAAGIVIPPAQPIGRYSAAQVARAYRTTRELLVAANLNGPTLAGGAPDAFASLLIPVERTYFVGRLDKIGLTARGYARSTRGWVVSFAPGTTQLVGSVIKVHGTMQAMTAIEGTTPVLRIHADYLFVYPVEAPDQPATLMRLVARDVVNVDFASWNDPGGPLEPYWILIGGGVSGARCDVNDGFVHPEFPGGPPDKVKPTGAPVNPYSQGALPAHVECQATTGT
jgi:hypothetical protein